jgi:hypothetical protein
MLKHHVVAWLLVALSLAVLAAIPHQRSTAVTAASTFEKEAAVPHSRPDIHGFDELWIDVPETPDLDDGASD